MAGTSGADLAVLAWPSQSQVATWLQEIDWQQHPLGAPDGWPAALVQSLSSVLHGQIPMWLCWGDANTLFYNDAFLAAMPMLQSSLAKPLDLSLLPHYAPLLDAAQRVKASGQGLFLEAQSLFYLSDEQLKERYYSLSLTPIYVDAQVLGALCIQLDQSQQILASRRSAVIEKLTETLSLVQTREALLQCLSHVFEGNNQDLPFLALYVFEGHQSVSLAGCFQIDPEHQALVELEQQLQARSHLFQPIWYGRGTQLHSLDTAETLSIESSGLEFRKLALVGGGRGSDLWPKSVMVVGMQDSLLDAPEYWAFLSLLLRLIQSTLKRLQLSELPRPEMPFSPPIRPTPEILVAPLAQPVTELDEERHKCLQALFEHAPTSICVFEGPKHVCVVINKACREMIGNRPLLGLELANGLPELKLQGFLDVLNQVYESADHYVGNNVLAVLQNGPRQSQQFYVNFVYQPMFDAQGKIRGVLAVFSDQTGQVKAEQELLRLLETVDEQVNERTVDLASALDDLNSENLGREQVHAALRHTQKMEALGHLTGGIAHDFNNLLTGMIGSLELAQWRLPDNAKEAVLRYLDSALASANRAVSLTKRLMVFSRKEKFVPESVHIQRLLDSMALLLQSSCGDKVVLKVEIPSDAWLVSCDASQLENALLNVVINARDAMPEGGKLRIAAKNQSFTAGQHAVLLGDYLCVEVIDTGFGMSALTLEHAFEPFFTTKDIGKGTGLGLAMVYSFAVQSKGYVKLTSSLGAGTQVALYLPRSSDVEEPVIEFVQLPELSAVKKYRILVVEDQASVRSLVTEVLEEMDCQVVQAEDGIEGLDILTSAEPFDLLLTDIGLPGINGRDLAKQARLSRADLKVLFMTGYAVGGEALEGATGISGLLAKPFSLAQLRAKVTQMLELSCDADVNVDELCLPLP